MAKLTEYRRKRDFGKTAEPTGADAPDSGGALRFVIQKHDASQLHYDLRLEMEGVMRSWAVPKGPSLDPSVRRLAMEVEDHPIEYNEFEGTIPEGEYGGGTVMLWDHGTYEPSELKRGEDPEAAALRGYHSGKLSFVFHGERLQGAFALVRTERGDGGPRSKWLFFKVRDEDADPSVDITESVQTSVTTGRTMEEIAAGKGGGRVWHSNRKDDKQPGRKSRGSGRTPPAKAAKKPDFSALQPMLARSAGDVPERGDWVFEPKYDGIRVLAFATEGSVALVTRNGHDKSKQFPEIAEALNDFVQGRGAPVVLDGEIVALEEDGSIARFESLQSRMHVTDSRRIARLSDAQPSALVSFDLLLDGTEVLIHKPWTDRRERLEEVVDGTIDTTLRLSEVSEDEDRLVQRARAEGWEGVIAKRTDAPYLPGQRTNTWLKLKIENQQEFVVGGWTEPRKSRAHLGAILLGYYDEKGKLVYAGHTGTGFTAESLADMASRLKPLERKTAPFREEPKTNEKAHWTTPKVVAEIKFNEWTRDGKLRQPVFLGVREDKEPREVVREPAAGEPAEAAKAPQESPAAAETSTSGKRPRTKPKTRKSTGAKSSEARDNRGDVDTAVSRRIRELWEAGGEGRVQVDDEATISFTSLGKVFFPETGHTKGDLLVYYGRLAEHILPWMEDRALVLKRFPNGVDEESFYQQAAPDTPPPGVRVETIEMEGQKQKRLVGGNLTTLLYTIQLGAISYDPWHSRITDLASADYTVLDLDPGPEASFETVIEVARYVREELDLLGIDGALKTSGSRGLHIYLPLPPKTPLDAATLVAQIVATRVVQKHPKIATVERMTRKRPRGTVYVDYLQNILGKTIAGVYAARAKSSPMVSTPLAWDELTDDLDLAEFTIDTVPERVKKVGDLWSKAMEKPISIEALT